MKKSSFESGVEERRTDGWCVGTDDERDDELVCLTSTVELGGVWGKVMSPRCHMRYGAAPLRIYSKFNIENWTFCCVLGLCEYVNM